MKQALIFLLIVFIVQSCKSDDICGEIINKLSNIEKELFKNSNKLFYLTNQNICIIFLSVY